MGRSRGSDRDKNFGAVPTTLEAEGANYARRDVVLIRRDSAAVAPLLRTVVRFAGGPLDAELAHTGTQRIGMQSQDKRRSLWSLNPPIRLM